MSPAAPPPILARWRWDMGLAYGALAAPLAFVSLPLYVTLPHHYATAAGVPLGVLGLLLLAVRALDAFIDPALGRATDRLFRAGPRRAWQAAALGSAVVLSSFAALWHPPMGESWGVLVWLGAMLLVCTLAYSAVAILHQSWGTRWGGSPEWRARVSAWREAATLLGVLLASALPAWLGLDATSAALALLLLIGLLALRRLPQGGLGPDPTLQMGADEPATPGRSPWADAAFRSLLRLFMVNGMASAIPATLLPFFVSDRLQASAMQAPMLLCYFGAAALGLPLWVRAVARWGLAPTWRRGMLLSVLAFMPTPWLGAGDSTAFMAVCLISGLALGADLALPGALLTGVIHQAGAGRRAEGVYLGWWACVSKLNLALAAGLALPLLAAAGYHSGSTDAAGLQALAWAYGGLPCLMKLVAVAALWRAEHRHPSWKDRT